MAPFCHEFGSDAGQRANGASFWVNLPDDCGVSEKAKQPERQRGRIQAMDGIDA
jgi:hypothetical protein